MDTFVSDYFSSFLSWFITWFVAYVFLCFSLFALFVDMKFSCPESFLFSLWHWAQMCSFVVYLNTILVWEWNAHFCSPTPMPEWAKKLKNWWRNEGEREEMIFSTQMSFLGTQCWHSNILNSSTVSKAIRHVTIPSESLERGLSACQVLMWIYLFPTEISPPQSRCPSHWSLWSPYFLWIISPLLLQISTMSCS